MANTKINGFRFNDSFVKKLKSFDAFKKAYKGFAYPEAPNEDELLKAAWEVFNPPAPKVAEPAKDTEKAAADK